MTRFSFWGLFAVFFAMLAAYWFWMRREERREDRMDDRTAAGNAAPPADRPPSATQEAGGERNASDGRSNGAGP